MKEQLSLGFSPCPNDCFIFDALVHQKIDTEGMEFRVHMKDVEELNKMAFQKNIDITKLSYHAFAHLLNDYVLLDSGSALGFGVGPLLIAKSEISNIETEIQKLTIAIPGKYTTANFLLSLAFPKANKKTELLFSEIESAVMQGSVDAGLIIHENRFTYSQKGLKKIIDLGQWWEKETGSAIPLGGIAISRNLNTEIRQKVNRIIRRSVEFAFANPGSSKQFVKENAQEMNDEVIQKHINLYVNEFSVDLGTKGKNAVRKMMSIAAATQIISEAREDIFL